MKSKLLVIPAGLFILLVVIQLFAGSSEKQKQKPEFRNFYGIAWNGTPHENLAFAKQMGYDYVFYQKGMELDSLSNGLHFYIETPEYSVYKRQIDTKQNYTHEEIRFAETHFALMNASKSFPNNIARGWFMSDHTFTPQLDLQQQKVISWAIDSILKNVESIEDLNPDFKFGGFAWDVPQPAGDFWDTIQKPGRQITLEYWTGGDYGIKHPDVAHEYPTYSEGRIEFYKQLYRTTRTKFPGAKFMMEPYRIYDDWIQVVGHRTDAKEVTPDLLAQERFGTEFVDDERIFDSGLITRENVASTTPDRFSEADNRLFAAKAAVNGAWFSWYGRFGGTGDMPGFRSIREVPARLKLIRVLANWENLNQTPLQQRAWDGTVYKSPNAFASPDVIAVKKPETEKLFVVFLTENGKVEIPKGKKVKDIYTTDDFFIEKNDADEEVIIRLNALIPAGKDCLEKGYIIELK
jgi:hypothetical protein